MAFVSFSTSHYRQSERLEAAQDLYAAMAKVALEQPRGEIPNISATLRLLPGVSIAFVECTSLTAQRGAVQVADGNDDLSLLINPSGKSGWRSSQQGLDETVCLAGQACLGMNDRRGKVDFHANGHERPARFLSIAFPSRLLGPLVGDVDRAARGRVAAGEALHHLTRLALDLTLPDLGAQADDLRGQHAVDTAQELLDLAALSLGAGREASRLARARGLRQARLRAIKADIVALASQGDITLPQVAARHGISPGYLRALFRHEDTSFTDFLVEQRLQRAYSQLSGRGMGERAAISAIAYENGFNNLSWFYRAFRRRFGMTPGEARDLRTDR